MIKFLAAAKITTKLKAGVMFEANRRIFLRSFAAGGDGHAAGYDVSAASETRRIMRNSILTRMIEAFHFSRRLEAARVLRRYHDLIVNDSQGQPNKRPTGIR